MSRFLIEGTDEPDPEHAGPDAPGRGGQRFAYEPPQTSPEGSGMVPPRYAVSPRPPRHTAAGPAGFPRSAQSAVFGVSEEPAGHAATAPAGNPSGLDDESYDEDVGGYPAGPEPSDGYDEPDEFDDPASDARVADPIGGRRRGSALKSLLAIFLSLGILLGGGYFAYTKLADKWHELTQDAADYPGPGEQEILVDIPVGASLTDMGNLLFEKDVVASARAFVDAARDTPGSSTIQPGTYRLLTRMKASDAVAALLDRSRMVINRITIPEGLRNTVVLQRISEQTQVPVADLEATLANPSSLGLPPWANGKTEGFLYPSTYSYDTDPTAQEILSLMPAQFNSVTTELNFAAKAEAQRVSPYDAVTIASIIEKETTDPKYGPDIAQVLYNRLRRGMKLQLDSTVIYAVNSPGTITTSDEERANPSPYNTYVHEGLPPGAISNPGRSALESAVNPTTGDYLYFVAVNPDTGETKFASTSEGHEANVAEFQAWCRANSDRCG